MSPPKKKKDGPLNVSFEDWRRICIAFLPCLGWTSSLLQSLYRL